MTELRAVNGDTAASESWDDFWQEITPAQRTEVICGVEVLVPTDMPLHLAARIEEMQGSESLEDMHELCAAMFGEGALADWIDAGITLRQLQTVFVWGLGQAQGTPISFREAFERVTEAEAGKAQGNRAQRRAAARPATRSRSAATGRPSKPTSSGSTGSRRPTSDD